MAKEKEGREINPLEHVLVPVHRLVPVEEEPKILERLGASKQELPLIRRSDPVIRYMERAMGIEIEEGRLIEIVRESPTAGRIVVYRVVKE